MPVFNQGEDYEENSEDTTPKPRANSRRQESAEEVDSESDGAEEEDGGGKKKKKKPAKAPVKMDLNPKVIACVCAIVVCIGAAVVFAGVLSSNEAQKAAEESMAEQQAHAQADAAFYAEHPELLESIQAESSEGETMETVPAPTQAPAQAMMQEAVTFYTETELYALRKWGFTANQIEVAARDGISAEGLVEQAKLDRQEAQKEAFEAVKDTASPEYLNLLNNTWLGGDPLDTSGFTPDKIPITDKERMNVDFEKVEARGTQLYIKVYLPDGKVAFMQTTPNRYNALPDSGNMVIDVSKEFTEDDIYVITSVTEVRVN